MADPSSHVPTPPPHQLKELSIFPSVRNKLEAVNLSYMSRTNDCVVLKLSGVASPTTKLCCANFTEISNFIRLFMSLDIDCFHSKNATA